MPIQFPFNSGLIIQICQRYDVSRIGVFGSVVRGETTSQSDLDLLVEFSKPKGLFSIIRLERELTQALGKPVDLVTEAALSPYLKKNILNEVQVIYET